MADYAASVLAKGQAKIEGKYNSPEQRRKIPTVMELALKNQHISIPDAQALRVSPLRTVDVNYFTDVTKGSSVAKAIAHTGSYGDSAVINVVYISHVETFNIPRKLAYNSIIAYQERFDNLYEMKWKNLRTRHDTSALAFLYANRCQLANSVMDSQIASANPGTWNETNYALEIGQGDKNLFALKAKALMASRFFSGPYDIIADLQLAAQFEYMMNQGSGNYANTTFQFDGTGVAATQDQIASAYPLGAALIMPQGSLAGLNWNEGLNRDGVDAGQNSVGKLGTANDPLGSGAVADLSLYTARTDTSANTTGGSTQDIVDQWELTLTIGYVLPPLSTASDSVVHLVSVVA